jgi:hypothetical protein
MNGTINNRTANVNYQHGQFELQDDTRSGHGNCGSHKGQRCRLTQILCYVIIVDSWVISQTGAKMPETLNGATYK